MKLFLVSIVRMLLASALVLSSQAAVPARAAEDTKSRPTAKPESKAATSNNCDEIDSVLRELISSRQMNGNQRIIGAITSGFPVLSNALGDMNEDGIINIVDLLRIRNIYLGNGSAPSPYEQIEGDLNQDGAIDSDDVREMLDVLVWRAGIPHEIGIVGGAISDRGIEISIPDGAMIVPNTFRVTHLSPRYLEEKHGIDIAQEEADSNWVMTAFRFESLEQVDFSTSAELTVRLDSLPPCSFRGLNAIYDIFPDMDGDGRSEIVYAGTMTPMADSLGLTLDIQSNPTLDSIGVSSFGRLEFKAMAAASDVVVYVGDILRIGGINLTKSCVMHFIDASTNMEWVLPIHKDSVGWYTMVPPHPGYPYEGGSVSLQIEDRANTLMSMSVLHSLAATTVNIAWNPVWPSNPDSVIVNYTEFIAQKFDQARTWLVADETMDPSDRIFLLERVEQAILVTPDYRDSLLAMPLNIRNRVASTVRLITPLSNAAISRLRNVNSSSEVVERYSALGCRWECYGTLGEGMLMAFGCSALIISCGPFCLELEKFCLLLDALHLIAFYKCVERCNDFYDDCPGGTIFEPDPYRDHFCPNILEHRGKICVRNAWPVLGGTGLPRYGEYLGRTTATSSRLLGCCNNLSYYHPLKGAIVRANIRLPFGALGIIDGDGGFQLPGIPPNSTITLAIYDPKTGLSDPNVATFATGNDLDQNMIYSPFILYNPDTSSYDFALRMGQPVSAAISASMPRIIYHFNLTPGDSAKVKLWSEEALTFWLQNETGGFIARDSLANCEDVVLTSPGEYRITVTYGAYGGDGIFEIGADHIPYYPISHLCGNLSGIVRNELSPCSFNRSMSVLNQDTLIIGNSVQFTASPGAIVNNYGSIRALSGEFDVVGGLTMTLCGAGSIMGDGEQLSRLCVKTNGVIKHQRGLLTGVDIEADTVVIDSAGSINVVGRGYRGVGRDGWTGTDAETYPGPLGSSGSCGGSHGGYGGTGGIGRPGGVYGSIDDPNELGAGSSGSAGGGGSNGGGLVSIQADVLELNGLITADGVDGPGGGGAGGSINIRAREIRGRGTLSAMGGNSGFDQACGGGGRIAVRWQEGDVGLWTTTAKGGSDYRYGGAGTIYFLGPENGPDGILVVDNGGRNGATTPLVAGRTQFKYAEIKGAGKLTIGAMADQLTVLDSVVVMGSNTQLTFSESTMVATPRLVGLSGGRVTLGGGMSVGVPEVWVDGAARLVTSTSLSFADAGDFRLTNGGVVENHKAATFTIPRFEPDNMISGTFMNWGVLNVVADSIVVNAGMTLEESGRLGATDSITSMRILGKMTHDSRQNFVYDDGVDTGLVFRAGTLVVDSAGSIDVIGRGYRGKRSDGWESDVSETYPGYTGSSGSSGGSHGGKGAVGWEAGVAGDVYGSVDDPNELGSGASTPSSAVGKNGGGLVRILTDVLELNGLITADGVTGGNGGAGGSINIRAREIRGSGTLSASGGDGGDQSGGGGGGRIAVRWQVGDIERWTISARGGDAYRDGGAGTIFTEQIPMRVGQVR